MKQKFIVTGMTCSACSAHVDKAVRKLAGVSVVNVNLLSVTMTVDWQGDLTADDIIAAVVKSGYGASLPQTGPSSSEVRARPAAHAMEEDLKNMRLRLIWSLVFLIPLFYLSMGHMMGWPIPAFFHGTENAMVYALTLFLLTVPTLIINQKYFRVGFKTLFHLSPIWILSSLWAPPPPWSMALLPCTLSAGGWAMETWRWWSGTLWTSISSPPPRLSPSSPWANT